MKIVIPMAGEGSRFSEAGYTVPKPLIEVSGKPMIQKVVENLPFDADFIFLVRQEHLDQYNTASLLQEITGNRCQIVPVPGLTKGAACTVLLARDLIDTDEEIFISNSDDLVEFEHRNFDLVRDLTTVDGIIFTFKATHPKWSFVRCDARGHVVEVAEKNPISDNATCGKYYFRKGSDFVAGAERMIAKNIRTNNEFYVCPVYNELIEDGKVLIPFDVHKMWGVGTPEDLKTFLKEAPDDL